MDGWDFELYPKLAAVERTVRRVARFVGHMATEAGYPSDHANRGAAETLDAELYDHPQLPFPQPEGRMWTPQWLIDLNKLESPEA